MKKLVPYHIETSQLIANQLAIFYTARAFAERCFRIDYNFNSDDKLMQWWGVQIRGDDRRVKIIFI